MVVKIIELVGVSPSSFEDSVMSAVKRASKTVHGISGVDIIGQSCRVKDGKVTEFRTNLKVAFVLEEK